MMVLFGGGGGQTNYYISHEVKGLFVSVATKEKMYNKIYQRQENDVANIMDNRSNPVSVKYSVPVNVLYKSIIVYRIKQSFDPQLHYV